MPQFEIGNIVSLTTHPFTSVETDIIIAGEAQLVPPLMIVIETVSEKFEDDKKSTLSENQNCKCIWYSHKSNKYEEAWLNSKSLKLISEKSYALREELDFLDSVVLTTADLELSKRKTSLVVEQNENSLDSDRTLTVNLLSFVPPIMQIISINEIKDFETKVGNSDSKKGSRTKIVSKWDVKCKWFNPAADKFSEIVLPIEALIKIEVPEAALLEKTKLMIEREICLKIETEDNNQLLQPKQFLFLNGQYIIKCYDYLFNRFVELKIFDLRKFTAIETYLLDKGPTLSFDKKNTLENQLSGLITQSAKTKSYIRVKYRDRYDKPSYRTLSSYFIRSFNDGRRIKYLVGFCNAKKGQRVFRFDRISLIEKLDLKFELPSKAATKKSLTKKRVTKKRVTKKYPRKRKPAK